MAHKLVTNRAVTQVATLNGAKAREVVEGGTRYLVAPTTLIVSGVLPGSKGRLFYPAEELSRDPGIWNGVPLTLGHPTDNGRAVSARSPQIRDRFGLGTVRNVSWDDKRLRLRGEAWVDMARAEKLRPGVVNRIKTGGPIEISTGLFTENEPTPGTYNGQRYDHVARDYRSDHLALLLDSRGACSVNDGCGLNVNQQTENANPQGCNQYGCKKGMVGKSDSTSESKTVRVAASIARSASQGARKAVSLIPASKVDYDVVESSDRALKLSLKSESFPNRNLSEMAAEAHEKVVGLLEKKRPSGMPDSPAYHNARADYVSYYEPAIEQHKRAAKEHRTVASKIRVRTKRTENQSQASFDDLLHRLTGNANPQGCNQYGCKKGSGKGKAGSYKSKLKDLRGTIKAGLTKMARMKKAGVFSDKDLRHYRRLDAKVKQADADRMTIEMKHRESQTRNQAQASFDDLRKALRRELTTRFGQVEIVDVFPKSVVYQRLAYGPQDSDTVPRLYEVGYSADKRGKVTLDDGGAEEVQRVTTYETVSNGENPMTRDLIDVINGGYNRGCNQYGCKGGGKGKSSRPSDRAVETVFGARETSAHIAGVKGFKTKVGRKRIAKKVREFRKANPGETKDLLRMYTFRTNELIDIINATNQDGRRVGPSVFNQEEEPDMAHEPLTQTEKEQLVTAIVTNCEGFGEDDREWLDGLDDDRLTAIAETLAENKVLNERVAELEEQVTNKKGAKNKGMPPWLKKKIDEKDAEDDEEEGEDDMEENSGCSKKPTKNAETDDEDSDNNEDCGCPDRREMTDDEWLEQAPASVRNAAQRYQAWEDQAKDGLVKTITANTRFTKEFLLQKPLEELEILAEPFQKKGRQAAPAYAGMGAPTVRMTANAEPDMEEPLGVPEIDYAAYSGIN